jgi:hypothetical protein
MSRTSFPVLLAQDLSWQDNAACRHLSLDDAMRIFFPEPGGNYGEAKKYCLGVNSDNPSKFRPECPVRTQCLEYALSFETNVMVGVWGGTNISERREIMYQRSKETFQRAAQFKDASLNREDDTDILPT